MKKSILLVLISIAGFSPSSFAQFANTKWAGTFKIPSEAECFLHFTIDTVELVMTESGGVVEGMKYVISGDTLTLTKLYGGSPCGDEPAIYTWKINANKLKLTTVMDNCSDRNSAGLDSELTKMKEPEPMKKDD